MSTLRIFDRITNAWVIPSDPIPDCVNAIISTSQGVVSGRLVRQNREHMDKVLEISREHPEAIIGFSAFAGSLDPRVERAIKEKMLLGKRSVFVGSVSNTASEAESYHRKLVEYLGHKPATVVLVTSQFHGRAVRLAYRKEFSHSRIILVFTPWQGEIDPYDLHILSRNKWLWLGAHIARQVLIAWVPFGAGYWLFKKLNIRQPNSHPALRE